MKEKTKKISYAGLFVALGVIIPFVTGHAFGLVGTVVLPMHFPVLVAGFILGPELGLLIGCVTPIISSVLTGMPVLFPMLPVMFFELGAYGFFIGYFGQKKKKKIYPSLLISMVIGRVVHAAVMATILFGTKGSVSVGFLSFLAEGIPGTILQLLIIPAVVKLLLRSQVEYETEYVVNEGNILIKDIEKRIEAEEISVAVIENNKIKYTDLGMGISPLLNIINQNIGILKDTILVDKIIGKAAAMLAVYGGVKEVYSLTISRAGKEYLEKHNVIVHCSRVIDVLENRTRTGICPFEKAVMDIEDPYEGYLLMQKTRQKLRKQA